MDIQLICYDLKKILIHCTVHLCHKSRIVCVGKFHVCMCVCVNEHIYVNIWDNIILFLHYSIVLSLVYCMEILECSSSKLSWLYWFFIYIFIYIVGILLVNRKIICWDFIWIALNLWINYAIIDNFKILSCNPYFYTYLGLL